MKESKACGKELKQIQYGGSINYCHSGERRGWRQREGSEKTGLLKPIKEVDLFLRAVDSQERALRREMT